MEILRKVIGSVLIVTGFIMLVFLATNFESQVYNAEKNPMYRMMIERSGQPLTIMVEDKSIILDEGWSWVISMVLTFLYLTVWLQIGVKMLGAGARMFNSELDLLSRKIDNLKKDLSSSDEWK